MIDSLIQIITLGGGLAGYASLVYLILKKFRKDVKIYSISGTYNVEECGDEGYYNINATIVVGFLNNSDETVSVTDVVGILKYNLELYEKRILSQIDVPHISKVYTKRPDNLEEIMIFSIEPHKVTKKTIKITFPNIILDLVDRSMIAHYRGLIDGETAFYTIDEKELKEKWSDHPLLILLSVHIDAKKLVNTNITLTKENSKRVRASGTLSYSEVEKIKKKFSESTEITAHIPEDN